MCLAVTCQLHFLQNDRVLLCATAVTRGRNRYQNKSQHRKLTLEKKILLPGFKPATFQSRVQCSNHWAISLPKISKWMVYHQSFQSTHLGTLTHSAECPGTEACSTSSTNWFITNNSTVHAPGDFDTLCSVLVQKHVVHHQQTDLSPTTAQSTHLGTLTHSAVSWYRSM